MKVIRSTVAVLFIAGLVGAMGSLSHAASSKNKKFDLYSWQKEGEANWCFVLVTSTSTLMDAATAKADKNVVCGHHNLKRLMGQTMPANSTVFWKVNEPEGLVLAPMDVVNDLRRFAPTMEYKIKLPDDVSAR